MTAGVFTITLPDHIHAEILTARDTVTGGMVTRGVVWADRTYQACGTCGEPVPQEPDCPVAINDGDGRGAQLAEYTQQHYMLQGGGGCAIWQPVLWAECGTSEDEITAAAAELAADRATALGSARRQIAGTLRAALADAMRLLAEGDDADEITTGSDTEPGVYLDVTNSGQWVAWDYDPDDEDGCGVITVYASDLAA